MLLLDTLNAWMGLTTSPVVAATLGILLLMSMITWTLLLGRLFLQWRVARAHRAFMQCFYAAPGLGAAEEAVGSLESPLARLARNGFATLRDLASATHRDLQHSGEQRDVLERSLRSQMRRELHRLEAGLLWLASIGSTAPFVGLFGTVWGIFHALKQIGQHGSVGLDVVAGPIGEALIATALGIATAIPAVLAYNFGVRRVRLMGAELEEFTSDFLRIAVKTRYDMGTTHESA
ncbi:MAG: MotA/TolQ/ExbB proton channel family protein [Pseudomonadota bacterium]